MVEGSEGQRRIWEGNLDTLANVESGGMENEMHAIKVCQ